VVLAIGAHPDDIEFFAGGTLVQWSQEGKEVYLLITTDGRRGSLKPETSPETLISIRKKEACNAAKILHAKKVFFLEYEDGFLDQTSHLELREKYIYYIRKLKPQLVLTFDPWNPYEPHSDHRKTALAAFESCYFSHYPLFHPEQKLSKHFVSEIWLFRSSSPDRWVPLKSRILRTKVKALLAHKSQMHMLLQEITEQLHAASINTSFLNQIDMKTLIDLFVRNTAEEIGQVKGYKYAEAFKVFKLGYVENVRQILQSMQGKQRM